MLNNCMFVLFFYRFSKTTNVFWHFCLCCGINRYVEYRIRIKRFFLYMGTYFKDIFQYFSTPKIEFVWPPKIEICSQKCEQFSYRGYGVLNGPLKSLKHPSEGYNVHIYIYIYNHSIHSLFFYPCFNGLW